MTADPEVLARVRTAKAHTLPKRSGSTRILEKPGFEQVGEIVDPADGSVWRWERTLGPEH